jgi:hypothetical protein
LYCNGLHCTTAFQKGADSDLDASLGLSSVAGRGSAAGRGTGAGVGTGDDTKKGVLKVCAV